MMRPPGESPEGAARPDAEEKPAERALPRVLVVEDDTTSANALRIILTRRGFTVNVAGDLHAAFDQLKPEPDVILLDLMLPDGDGLAMFERLKQLGLSVRVIVTTAVSDPDRLIEARRQRPQAILQKPINLNELLRIIGA